MWIQYLNVAKSVTNGVSSQQQPTNIFDPRKGLGFCDLCQESVQNFIYQCIFVIFSLDVKCAQLSIEINYPCHHLHPVIHDFSNIFVINSFHFQYI